MPFDFATSDELPELERVAWVRALNVDERLTVIAASPASTLAIGNKIVDIEGFRSNSGKRMTEVIKERRDGGRPFQVTLVEGKKLRVEPVRTCRGLVLIAPPLKPAAQDYHWSYSLHPLDVFRQDLTSDEALWLVLWTQGLSEEGGARMKAYQYGAVPAQFLAGVASLLMGVGPLAKAIQAGSTVAASQAGVTVVTGVVTSQAIGLAKQQTATLMEASSKNRAKLKGVAWVGGTVFDKADKWAFDHMTQLGADPLAGMTLHQKLIESGRAENAFVLDAERLPMLQAVAEEAKLGTRMTRLLSGEESPAAQKQTQQKADDMIGHLTTEAMPQASDKPAEVAAEVTGEVAAEVTDEGLTLPVLTMESQIKLKPVQANE